jgi:hypothetical protein
MRNCNCSNTIRQNKDEIKKRAIKFSKAMEFDVQIHSWTERGFGRLWDFEEKGTVERGRGVVEVIEFRKHKSKNVLPDTKTTDTSKKIRKSRRKMVESDEPVRDSKPTEPTDEVE